MICISSVSIVMRIRSIRIHRIIIIISIIIMIIISSRIIIVLIRIIIISGNSSNIRSSGRIRISSIIII